MKGSEQKTVKALYDNFREDLTGGTKIFLKDAFDLYLKKPSKRTAGEKQLAVNRTYWQDFVAFMAANFPNEEQISDVTQSHAENYIALLRSSGAFIKDVGYNKGGHNYRYTLNATHLAPRTINARHSAIKAVFARLAADAGIIQNPFEDIAKLDNHTQSRDAFSDEELRLIGEAMTMPISRPIFTIGLCTGLTLGDICLLKWKEIAGNWITNKIRAKTGVAVEIPILPPLAAFLDEQREKTGCGEYVVPELAKMYLNNPGSVIERVRLFLESIGIKTNEKIKGRSRAVSTKAAHAMRHTFAYLAGVYGIPQPIVQGVLGHLSPQMTALYQKHAQREAKEKFFKRMPNVLGVAEKQAIPMHQKALPPADEMEPERKKLLAIVQLADIEIIKEILAQIQKQNKQ